VKKIEFAPNARAELEAAAEYYERDYAGRGLRFYSAVERAVHAAAAFPEAGPPFPRVTPALAVRRRIVPGFPFVIAYRDRGDVLRVEAVAHVRRRPGYWLRRLK
jgi:plasmid stabilization system protein ParE